MFTQPNLVYLNRNIMYLLLLHSLPCIYMGDVNQLQTMATIQIYTICICYHITTVINRCIHTYIKIIIVIGLFN